MKGMILTAGLGTRLKPLTENKPKALVKIGEHTMLDLCIRYLSKHGVDEFIINVHHYADQLMEFVAQKRWEGLKIEISNETDGLMNTGGGLKKAEWFFTQNEDFVLLAVDILTDLDLSSMIKNHQENKQLVTLAVKKRKTSRDLTFDKDGLLAGWKHNQTGETKEVAGRSAVEGFGFSGIHVLNSEIFKRITESGDFSIIDMYLRLAADEIIYGYNHTGDTWLEFGKVSNIEDATKNPDFNRIVKDLYSF